MSSNNDNKNNRRRSLRSGVTSYRNNTPPPKQTHLTPLNRVIKRTYSKNSSSGSVSRWQDTTLTQCGYVTPQDQVEIDTPCENKPRRSTGKRNSRKSFQTQTLTQAGFVSYQSPVDENMDYDEVSAARHSSPSSKKRRRSELEEPITSRTRSAKKRAAEQIVKSENEVEKKIDLKLASGLLLRQSVTTVAMPPPKTPQSIRRREVPSSQSPADSPLSTRSRRSRDVLRSPLKDKSVNVRRRVVSPGETKSWARMGVAADSLEFEDEHEEDPRSLAASATSIKFEPLNDSQPLAATRSTQVDENLGAKREDTPPSGGGPFSLRKSGKLKSEISDSDNDIDETDEESFDPVAESQVDMSSPNLEINSSIQADADLATGLDIIPESEETPKYGARTAKQADTPTNAESEVQPLFTTPRLARDAQTRATSRAWLSRTIDHQSARHHNHHRLPIDSPSNSRVPSSSSSVNISRPLINKLSPLTYPHAVLATEIETEVQLRKAWHFTPPPTVETGPTLDLPITQPNLPTYPIHVQPQPPQIPPHQRKHQQLPPVPPSHATTVDEITQHSSSPRGPLLPSSPHPPSLTFINTDVDDNDIGHHNDPPEEEPDTLARDIGGWEAVRLSDSQLQIDSLIDDDTMMVGRGRRHPHVSLLSSSPMRYDGGGGSRY